MQLFIYQEKSANKITPFVELSIAAVFFLLYSSSVLYSMC